MTVIKTKDSGERCWLHLSAPARRPIMNQIDKHQSMEPMNSPVVLQHRRRFIKSLSLGTALLTVPGAFAAELVRTPPQTEGPFYPDHLPLDTDNDLIIVNDALTPAVGEITHQSGRILDGRGDPVRNALVEIWQVDNNGVYLHSG